MLHALGEGWVVGTRRTVAGTMVAGEEDRARGDHDRCAEDFLHVHGNVRDTAPCALLMAFSFVPGSLA